MSTPHPHSVTDLALAPVLIEIERSIAPLRDSRNLFFDLALVLNDDASMYPTAAHRAERIRRFAVRDVDLRGWAVVPTSDGHGLSVGHGEYQVTLMLGRQLTDYVNHG